MFKKINGVLLDLNKAEREAFDVILALAERHLEETPRFKWSDGRYMSAQISQSMVTAMIEGLREELDLPEGEISLRPLP